MKTYPTNQILKNKIAIITGAGSGIGKCMVERFVQEGAQCLAADLNQDSLNALVEDLGDCRYGAYSPGGCFRPESGGEYG